MGIRGLAAFVERCPFAWDLLSLKAQTPEEIASGKQRSIKLVMDGNGTLYHLYFHNNFNCVCGGQYPQFAEFVKDYFGTLLKCGFSPFVVMDGTIHPQKEATVLSRENDLVKTVRQLTYSEKYFGRKVIPLLARQAFVDVLQELKIRVAYADSEADAVIASLAKANGCCAVSQDSDFFIFDLPAGYVPIDKLEVNKAGLVTARRFNRVKFMTELKIKPEMMSLLASAVGNDFVGPALLRPWHVSLGTEDEVKMPAGWVAPEGKDGKESTAAVRDAIIVRVAAFIGKYEEVDKAIAAMAVAASEQHDKDKAALVKVSEEAAAESSAAADKAAAAAAAVTEAVESFTADKFKEALSASLKLYVLTPKLANSLGATTELTTKAPVGFPPSLIQAIREGRFDPRAANVLVQGAFWCVGQVEDVESPSCWLISRPLRSKLYGMILEGSADSVSEYIRTGSKVAAEAVAAEASGLPGLSKVWKEGKLSPAERRAAVFAALGEEDLQAQPGVGEALALPLACVRYWLRNAGGASTAAELAAVLVAMLQKPEEAATRVSKEARPPWLSMRTAHRLAQLQTVVHVASLINQALGQPAPALRPAALLDGELTHKFHHGQQRAKGIAALGDQLRKDGVDAGAFEALFRAATRGVESLVRGGIEVGVAGGVQWSAAGPEGRDEDNSVSKKANAQAAGGAVAAGKSAFVALLGDEEEEEDKDEEDKDEEAPAPAPAASAAAAAAAADDGKKGKKKADETDEDMAKLLAEMEAVDAKRAEQRKKDKDRKKKK